jgi:hypothetical protein
MLPNANDTPTRRRQPTICLPVATHVSTKLPPPPLTIGAREAAMTSAAVPEAAVDEHGDAGGHEQQVNLSS